MTGDTGSALRVIDAPDLRRYEIVRDGTVVGYAAYQKTDQLIVFTHTEVDPSRSLPGLIVSASHRRWDDGEGISRGGTGRARRGPQSGPGRDGSSPRQKAGRARGPRD